MTTLSSCHLDSRYLVVLATPRLRSSTLPLVGYGTRKTLTSTTGARAHSSATGMHAWVQRSLGNERESAWQQQDAIEKMMQAGHTKSTTIPPKAASIFTNTANRMIQRTQQIGPLMLKQT